MNKFKKFLLIEFVVFIANVLNWHRRGLLLEKLAGPTHGYFTSSIIGIAARISDIRSCTTRSILGCRMARDARTLCWSGIGAVLVWNCGRIAAASA
jgi:hypothetical protein